MSQWFNFWNSAMQTITDWRYCFFINISPRWIYRGSFIILLEGYPELYYHFHGLLYMHQVKTSSIATGGIPVEGSVLLLFVQFSQRGFLLNCINFIVIAIAAHTKFYCLFCEKDNNNCIFTASPQLPEALLYIYTHTQPLLCLCQCGSQGAHHHTQ